MKYKYIQDLRKILSEDNFIEHCKNAYYIHYQAEKTIYEINDD
jgi:hypothetical protein